MCKKARRKSSKFMSLLLAVVLICGMLQVQVLAAETESVPVTMMKETETNNQTDVGEAENEGCIVAFDPDDGKTGYSDFFKVTVPTGSKVTEKPEDPQRDGYFFKGWYAFEDGDGNPVFWNFETDTVQDNTTLWAAWEKVNDGGDINISGGNGNGENSGGGNGNGEDSGSGNGNNYVKIEDEKIPAGFLDLNDIPKTNDSASRHLLLWLLCGISVSGMITLTLLRKKKWVKS